MSSSTSSSSSHSQRSPLHERSNSEKNKLQIRVVPYTPPRLDEVEAGDSHAREAEAGNDGAHHTAINPSGSASTGLTPYGKEGYQGFTSWSPSSTLSPSSPASPSARVQGSRVSASKPSSDSSGAECTAPPAAPVLSKASYGSNIRRINAPTRQSRRHEDDPASPASPTWRKSKYRRDINVHSDKTFSVVLKPVHARYSDRSESSLSQPPLSNTSTVSSHERISFDAPIEDLHSSPLSSVAERSVSSSTPASPTASTELPEDHITSSPENYRLIGGLRKVPRTPDLKNKGKGKEVATRPLPPLPEAPTTPPKTEPSHVVATKSSFSSELSASTVEETTNYKVLGRSSPPLPDSDSIYAPPSSSSPNYKLLGRSSPPKPFVSSPPRPQGSVDTPSSQNFAVPSDIDTPGSKNFIVHRNIDTPRSRNFIAYSDIDTPQSQDLIGYSDVDTPGSRNFVVHGNPSASSSVYAFARRPRRYSSDDSLHEILAKYSQESLVIAPLEARKRPLSERFGHYKQNSRDSLRGRADSFSSISSIVSQDTPNIVRFHSTASISSIPQTSWAGPSRPSSVGTSRALMDTHQWSSQLSTVPSEYEGTERSSRVISIGSLPDRSSSARGSRNSRQIRSISSSILENLEPSQSHSRSNSRSDSLERPAPVFARGARELPSPPLRTEPSGIFLTPIIQQKLAFVSQLAFWKYSHLYPSMGKTILWQWRKTLASSTVDEIRRRRKSTRKLVGGKRFPVSGRRRQ
ncbi:Uu.00g000870.m01.CDS01 [Anthostomella pinea]|uniref:Uu.00g000870.m01.CDS01 n=1 Tax=Anthostomella pinea TaxID=933095 RepID=A0AAI8YIL2_9PEZI|nr:Uu.00g000870.m01.CDS01 [Anthostomella pinea]